MPEDSERRWCVKRLDDNGNVFVLRAGLTRDEAECLVAEYQARGHKQSYWVERVELP
ncbi:hypothetical protein ACFPU0_12355 [Pseudomonas sp. GCM10022186]|uniref:hypothetical protein n=1 Tax=Pseudomonas sp. GCM10022186 TaxID=3252650 RepID=UPI003608C963